MQVELQANNNNHQEQLMSGTRGVALERLREFQLIRKVRRTATFAVPYCTAKGTAVRTVKYGRTPIIGMLNCLQ